MKPSAILRTLALLALVASTGHAGQTDTTLVRIATMPEGAEVTGLSSTVFGDILVNAQHPGGENTFTNDAPPGLLGYLHGFDPATYAGGNVAVPPVGQRDDVTVAAGEYVVFGRAGDRLGSGQLLGGVYDVSGELMYVSNAPDFNGFVPRGANTAYLYTSWEGAGRNGIGAVSRIALQRIDGMWQADLQNARMLDLSSVDGGLVLCSGVVTPWGTPLLAEEYFFYDSSIWNHPNNHDDDERASYEGGNDNTYIKPKNVSDYLGRMGNPYRYGYMIEINNAGAEQGEQPVKHYATGRLSHETAAIMPDMKTVYMTDDDSAIYAHDKYNNASGGVLFKFFADRKGDLSSGTLYAAKLDQDAEQDPNRAGFDVVWLELGHASNAEIAEWIAEYDGVTVDDYVEGETSYISDAEIMAYVEGNAPDARAAFLESRRTAAAMGATNEWDKLEGISNWGNTVYISASAISFTMDKSWGHKHWSSGLIESAESGDIALNAEACGGTYIAKTGTDYNISRIDPYVIGKSTADGRCDENLPANPDNILALSGGMLLIGEDAGSKKHAADMLWMVK